MCCMFVSHIKYISAAGYICACTYFCDKFLRDSFVRKNKTEGRVINAQNRGKQYYREDGACVLYAEEDSPPPFLFSFFFLFF